MNHPRAPSSLPLKGAPPADRQSRIRGSRSLALVRAPRVPLRRHGALKQCEPMKDLQGITVLVLGLGDSGLAMARWCARHGASVRVWDSREHPPQARALAEHVPEARLASGELGPEALDGVQRVLKSPGLSPQDARLAALLAHARELGVPVQGELDLFAEALAELKAERRYAPKVLAITGTNGKTTTTAMTALLVERAGKRVAVAGNIGPTMLQTLAEALEREPEAQAEVEGQADVEGQAEQGKATSKHHPWPRRSNIRCRIPGRRISTSRWKCWPMRILSTDDEEDADPPAADMEECDTARRGRRGCAGPDRAAAACRAGVRAPARSVGAGALELPARCRLGLRARRGHRAQHHPGPSRLARHDGFVRPGQGAHLRQGRGDGHQPRRRPGRSAGARAHPAEGHAMPSHRSVA